MCALPAPLAAGVRGWLAGHPAVDGSSWVIPNFWPRVHVLQLLRQPSGLLGGTGRQRGRQQGRLCLWGCTGGERSRVALGSSAWNLVVSGTNLALEPGHGPSGSAHGLAAVDCILWGL